MHSKSTLNNNLNKALPNQLPFIIGKTTTNELQLSMLTLSF